MGQPIHCGEYPTDWPATAKLVKDEAAWKCVRCGHGHDPSTGYTLTVHHFTGDKSCCERWNLMPLCQRCHLSVQARVNPLVPILYDPRPWCMPYIAGLYEAGLCPMNPGYTLTSWIRRYEREVGPWPAWAPRPEPSAVKPTETDEKPTATH